MWSIKNVEICEPGMIGVLNRALISSRVTSANFCLSLVGPGLPDADGHRDCVRIPLRVRARAVLFFRHKAGDVVKTLSKVCEPYSESLPLRRDGQFHRMVHELSSTSDLAIWARYLRGHVKLWIL